MHRFLPVFCFLLSAAAAYAAPVRFCKDGPGINLVTTGCVSGDGDGFFVEPGDTEAAVEQAIFQATATTVDLVLYGKSDDDPGLFTFNPLDPADTQSGTWSVDDGTLIRFITIKAAKEYAVYDVGSVSSGLYTSLGLLTPSGRPADVSHISFWTTAAAVPEPGTYALFGAGLTGLALLRRRQRPE